MSIVPALIAATLNPTLFILDNATIPTSVTAPHYIITGYHVSQVEMINPNGRKTFGQLTDIISPSSGLHIDPYDQALNVKFNGNKVPKGDNIFLTTIDSVDVSYQGKPIHINCEYSKATTTPMLSVNIMSVMKDQHGKLNCFVSR